MTYSEATPEFRQPVDSPAEPAEPTQDASEGTESAADDSRDESDAGTIDGE